MCFKTIKKECQLTISRKLKKRNFIKTNLNLYTLGKRYNLESFFFKHYNIKLNKKLLENLIKEELGFFYSFNNWLYFYYKKIY